MALNRRLAVAACGVLLSYGIVIELQFACGVMDPEPLFILESYPDEPHRDFLKGRLGIIEPSFLHTYLFWTYRNLSGVGFSEAEQRELTPAVGRAGQGTYWRDSAISQWNEARKQLWSPNETRVFEFQPQSQMRRLKADEWQFYVNCPDDALNTAAATLKARIEQFGKDSGAVRDWLAAQETVFRNCEQGQQIPPAAPADAPEIIKADREYQIAAAYFYSQNFDEAARRFERIGADTSSPWSRWGKYLAARCFLRKGMLNAGPGEVDSAGMEEAVVRLRAVVEDPSLGHVHESARGLLRYARGHLVPGEVMASLSKALLEENTTGDLEATWHDYDWLLDRYRGGTDDDLTNWLLAFRGAGPSNVDYCLRQWREKKSLPWLVAVLQGIGPEHEAADTVLGAASKLPKDSPAYVTATYHRLRLQLSRGEEETVRNELDDLLASTEISLPPSTRNRLRAMRLPLARTFVEFLEVAPRDVVWRGVNHASDLRTVSLDLDATLVFNEQLPIRLMIEAANSELLPAWLRKDLALAAWVRAALLDEIEVEPEARALVSRSWPELSSELAAYGAANDSAGRGFTLAYFLLRHPGARPYVRERGPIAELDTYRDNWWCQFDATRPMHYSNTSRGRQPRSAELIQLRFPAFLSAEQRQSAERQIRKLLTIPTAPNHLTQVVVNWAKQHADDERVPEALHLAVRSTRFGCADEHTTQFSRAAFQMLHRRYPRSDWTQKTKYWY